MAVIYGTTGNDTLIGTAEADMIYPLGGWDTVDGLGGADTLVIDYTNYGFIDPYAGAAVPDRPPHRGDVQRRLVRRHHHGAIRRGRSHFHQHGASSAHPQLQG